MLDKGKDISDWLELDGDVGLLPSLEQDVSALFDGDKPCYSQEEDSIKWRKRLIINTILFKAERLSEERTGIHARVTVSCDHSPLAWSYLNIERAEERTRLANAAHKQLAEETAKEYSKDDLMHDLDNFCSGLWNYHVLSFTPELMEGDEKQEPPSFLLHPYVLENAGTFAYSPPGRGKSYSALLWTVSINSGCDKFWKVKQVPTLFINLERSRDSLRRRLASVNKVLGLSARTPLHIINARGKALIDILPACRSYIKQYDIKLIVLDSVSRAGYGDLNENQTVNRIIDSLNNLCSSWIALAHTSRANEDHLYGSIMQDAGADICVQLSSQILDNGTLGIGWQITKQNDIPKFPQAIYALEFNEFGLSNFRKAHPCEFPEVEGKNRQDMLTTIIDYIQNKDTGDASATEIEEQLSFDRATVSKLFTKSGKFVKTRQVKHSVYYGIKSNREQV